MYQPSVSGPETFDYVFKVIVAGDSGTGKTSLMWRWVTGKFKDTSLPTVGVDTFSKILKVNGTLVKLEVWDTAGLERYRTLTQNFFNSVKAAVVVYDVTSESSMRSVPTWLNDVNTYGGVDVLKVVVGNKCDVSEGRAEWCDGITEDHVVTHVPDVSAKTGQNVDVIFSSIAKKLADKYNRYCAPKKTFHLESSKKDLLNKCSSLC